MLDNRGKRRDVKWVEEVRDIPGEELLVFDRKTNKWLIKAKWEVQGTRQHMCFQHAILVANWTRSLVKRGWLWRLPHGLKFKYRVPAIPGANGGYFEPWKQLSLRKNMKRIRGGKMKYMWIEGRQTTAQLKAAMSS
jgi:hypothetical protein